MGVAGPAEDAKQFRQLLLLFLQHTTSAIATPARQQPAVLSTCPAAAWWGTAVVTVNSVVSQHTSCAKL
jgi:hypothetical protein